MIEHFNRKRDCCDLADAYLNYGCQEYAEVLLALEDACADFRSAKGELEYLRGDQRQYALQQWKENLEAMYRQCHLVIESLEESLRNVCQK